MEKTIQVNHTYIYIHNFSHQGILNWKPTKDTTKSKRKKHPMRRRFSTRPLEGVDLSGQVRCEICEARRLRNSSCLVPLVMSIPRWLWESSEGCGIFGFPEAEFLPNSDSVCLTKQKPAEFLDHEKKRFLRSTKTDGIFSLRLHIYDMRTHERLNSPIFRQMPFYQNWLTWEGMTSATKSYIICTLLLLINLKCSPRITA